MKTIADLTAEYFNKPELLAAFRRGATLSAEEIKRRNIEAANSEEGDLKGYDCRKCKNRGYSYVLKDGCEYVRECECMQIRQTMARIKESGLEKVLSRCTFEAYTVPEIWQQKAKAIAMKYAELKPKNWLYVSGQSGSGKTHLCTAVCGELIKSGCDVKYIIWLDLLHKLEGLRFRYDDYRAALDDIRAIDVLYIDDFLKGSKGETALQAAFEVINERYISGKVTIISSEIYTIQLKQLDEATAGRIVERCGKWLVQIASEEGRNYRGLIQN